MIIMQHANARDATSVVVRIHASAPTNKQAKHPCEQSIPASKASPRARVSYHTHRLRAQPTS
jgi:hypothetical protein